MKTNTLVTHNKLKSLGIGCVAKVLKTSVKVNFGKDDVLACSLKAITEVDTSKCETIPFSEFQRKSICNSWKGKKNIVIIGNEVKQYVGIGWVHLHVVTVDDLTKYPRIVD